MLWALFTEPLKYIFSHVSCCIRFSKLHLTSFYERCHRSNEISIKRLCNGKMIKSILTSKRKCIAKISCFTRKEIFPLNLLSNPIICVLLVRFCDLVNSLLHHTESPVEDSSPIRGGEGDLEVREIAMNIISPLIVCSG